MKKITFLLFALLFSFVGYSQFPTPGTEGFENTTGPDLALPVASSSWTLSTGATGNQWAVFDNGVSGTPQKRWDRATTNFYNGTQAAFINRKQNGGAGITSEDYLATPKVTIPANGQLTFYTRTGFNSSDAVNYYIKINTNTSAGSQINPANYTITAQAWDKTTIAATYNIYELKTVDLSAYANQQVYIAFVRSFTQPAAAIAGNSWYVDDVKLVQLCPAPTSQTATNFTSTTASLSWTTNGSTKWEIEVVPVTSTPTGSGTIYNGTLPYIATGLTPNTGYVYYVRSVCTDSNSPWSTPYNFSTLQAGLNCAGPITVSSILTSPYTTTDNTSNYANTYSVAQPTACAGTATNYMAGNDVFYSYTAEFTGAISITMTPTGTNSSIFVYQGCSNVGVSCLAGVANTTGGVRSIPNINVTAGQTYIIVLSSSATTLTYPYTLVIQKLNCAAPTGLIANGTTSTSTLLSWSTPTSTSWEYLVQPLSAGSTIPTASGTTTASNTNVLVTTLTNPATALTPDTDYQFWVRAACGDGTFSNWTGPFAFRTSPICGGTFVDSGRQTANYANNTTPDTIGGTTTIYPDVTGNQVTVTFTSFNTELNNDVLKVYNGIGTSGTLLGTYSGTTIPPAITSSSLDGCLTFVFTSNPTTTASGWVANITCAPAPTCQKPILLTAPIATTTFNSVVLGWTQPQNPDSTIATTWDVIALACGSAAPTATTTPAFTISSNPFPYTGLSALTCYDFYVRAVCSSTSSSAWSGPVSVTTAATPPVCGGTFLDPGGNANYPNNSNLPPTIITPTTPGDQVTVTFTAFNTQLNTDILKVYDGSGTGGTLLATYSGAYAATALPFSITSSSPNGALTFVFTSNATTTASGWVANVTCAPAPACQKPILLTAPTATVAYNQVVLAWTQPQNPDTTTPNLWEVIALPCSSPAPTASSVGIQTASNPYTYTGLTALTCYNFYVRAVCSGTSLWCGPITITTPVAPPICGGSFVDPGGVAANYPNNITAATGTTTITPTTPGDQVTVTFTSFNTQLNTDILNVYDGLDSNGTLLASYSGAYAATALPFSITSSSPTGALTFVFTSDATTNAAGWFANVTCAPAPACQKPILLTTSAILSTSVNLSWTQTPNPDASITNTWDVIALPCGSVAPTATTTPGFTSVSNPFTYTGLNATTCYDFYVRAHCSSSSSSAWIGPKSATTALGCGGQFVNVQGTTAGSYPANSDSTVTICPSNPGDQVTVTFTSFATESSWDGLYVFDGNSNTSPQIPSANGAGNVPGGVAGSYWGTLTGANLPGPFTASSPSGCLTFRFRSDSSVSTGGWAANITCAPVPTCTKPSNLNVTTGSITGTTITYNWTQPANPNTSVATSWQVIILPCGSPTPTATTTGWQTVNTNSYAATGLNNSTCYDFYVMAVCSATDFSPIKGLLGTKTTCGAQQASSTCDLAPAVCISADYCGNTSSDFVPPHTWPALVTAFCGSIENNSFVNFQATAATATFQVYVFNSLNNFGVQFFAFDGACNGSTVTSHGCLAISPTGPPSALTPTTFTMTGLIPGNTYHLMFDGYAGDVCDFVVKPQTGIQTNVSVTPTSASICAGQNVTLTASGGNNAYTWSPSTGLSATTGTSVIATPTVTTTYTVTSSSVAVSACTGSQSVTVTVNPILPAVTDFSYTTPVCSSGSNPLPITATGFTTGGTYTSTSGLVINSATGEINLVASTPNTYVVTYSVAANPALCRVANSSTATITINPVITTTFSPIGPICQGLSAPSLPTTSSNTPTTVTGTWNPATIDASTLGTISYSFTPALGQCATPTTLSITVDPCTFGAYASAVWLTNCSTSNFFNTVGSGANLIGPIANFFPSSNLGTYIQNSSALLLRGAEVKTYKNASSNVCSAHLNYRIYSGTAATGAFQVMNLPFFSNCGSGSFINGGGPCNTGDQKWQKVLPNVSYPAENPIDLTTYPPGNYSIQVYYDVTGSSTSTSGCTETVFMDNGGAYYTATFTIQEQPAYTSTNPITCSGLNGTITISGMAPNTAYGVTYNIGTTTVGPTSLTSNSTGQIIITGLGAGTYSNFLVTINGCSYPYSTPIVLVDPTPPSVSVNSPTACIGDPATLTATPNPVGTYTYVWTVPSGTNPGNMSTFTTTIAGTYSVSITDTTTGCTSISGSGTVAFSTLISPTFDAIAPICKGATAPTLQTSSTNIPSIIGTWSPTTIDSNAVGNTTYTFTPNSGQCSSPISIVVTVNATPTPTATVIMQPTCTTPTGTAQVTSPLSVVGTPAPTDLFISEVTDSNTGALSYIELYNGTGATVNLADYTIKTANNGNGYTFNLPLNSGSLATGNTYVVALGIGGSSVCNTITGGDGSLAAQSSGSGSVNFTANGNDHFGLFHGTTQIDSWGTFGNSNWAPSFIGTEGADFRRKNTISPLPNTTYNDSDWDILDYAGSGNADCANNDYSNIGIYSMPTTTVTYQYSVDGGTYQSSPIFTGLTPGVHTITVQDIATGCTSSITVTVDPLPALPIISGTLSACIGNTTQLSGNGTPATTNAWTSSNVSVATIDSTGLVTGVLAGTSIIT
ncbi:MAG: CUB domain-containing protein, partial [Flavobacterium sp.]